MDGSESPAPAFEQIFTPVSRSSRLPRYAQVIAQIEAGIRRGLIPQGTLLPNEQRLCELFNVARTTLRRAMGLLESKGAISRTPRRGTRVESGAAIEYHPETSHTIFELISANRRVPHTNVSEFKRSAADAETAQLTGFTIGTDLIAFVRQRYADEQPIALLEDTLLAESVTFDLEDLVSGSLDSALERQGWAADRIEYEISASSVGADHAGFMGIAPGTPVLHEHRSAYKDGVLFHVSKNQYHPTNYRIRGVLDR